MSSKAHNKARELAAKLERIASSSRQQRRLRNEKARLEHRLNETLNRVKAQMAAERASKTKKKVSNQEEMEPSKVRRFSL